MSRVIYSLYIDIPDKELDLFDKNILRPQGLPTNYYNKKQFRNNYRKLLANKKWYADNTADFLMFEYGPMYKKFELQIKRVYPFITTYNIVNFFKLKLLYELAKEYEEILYLDFDVVCLSKDNFFDNWNLNKGIAVFDNTFKVNTMETITKQTQTIRSPTSKYTVHILSIISSPTTIKIFINCVYKFNIFRYKTLSIKEVMPLIV